MGLVASNLKYIIRAKKKHKIRGPVLTFGNQDIYATKEDVISWLTSSKVSYKYPKKIFFSTSKGTAEINKEANEYIHAKTFFEFIGIREKDYFDIDKFSFDNPKILHDLEKPIQKKYHNFFNFILDSGTLEHIFDVRAVMENIVRATKTGGYVLQFIPAQNFLNHGFYQISPTFFYDFYTANGFQIVESYIVEVRGHSYRFHEYHQKLDYLALFFNPKSRLINCFLVKKIKTVKQITSPTQYIYKKLAENPRSVERDFKKDPIDKVVAVLRGLIPIKYHGIFFGPWFWIKRLLSSREFFDL